MTGFESFLILLMVLVIWTWACLWIGRMAKQRWLIHQKEVARHRKRLRLYLGDDKYKRHLDLLDKRFATRGNENVIDKCIGR